MELVFLGTGAGLPSKQRNVTAICLRLQETRAATWLFDCGEGTQHQVLYAPVKLNQVEKIWVTHLHGDHIFGLPGLLGSRSFQGGERALDIYGPPGLGTFVEASLTVSKSHLNFPFHVWEVHEGIVFEDDEFVVEAKRLSHGIPSFGFRVVEKDTPGELHVEKLRAEGVPPGPVYGQLKRGKTVTLPDGKVIHGRDYLSPPNKGRILTILGDTKKSEAAVTLAMNADVLVHEATFSAEQSLLAQSYHHSTSLDAAEVALKAGAKALILTHISARYQGNSAESLLSEARSIFPETFLAEDFFCFPVTKIKP